MLAEEAEVAEEDEYYDMDTPPPQPIIHTNWQRSGWRRLRFF